jgi:acetamidase/formamidase
MLHALLASLDAVREASLQHGVFELDDTVALARVDAYAFSCSLQVDHRCAVLVDELGVAAVQAQLDVLRTAATGSLV